MTEPSPSRLRTPQKAALVAVTLVVVWFTLRRLESSFTDAVDVVRASSRVHLAAGGLLALASMTTVALGWQALLRGEGSSERSQRIVSWYFVGEITKYVPGGVWAVLGRAELAAPTMGRRTAYASVTHSLLLFFGVASLPALVAVARVDGWSLPVRIAGSVALAAVLPAVVAVVRRPARIVLEVGLCYSFAWLAIGLTTFVISRGLDVELGLLEAVTVTAAAWLAGFAIVFVPGGVGVREAVFVGLAPSSLEPSQALAIALCARLLFVAADMVGAGLGLVFRGVTGTDGDHR